MTKAHFITAAAALALGWTGAMVAEGYEAKAAVATEHVFLTQFIVPVGAGNTLQGWLEAQALVKVDAELGLDGADITTVNDMRNVCFRKIAADAEENPGRWEAAVRGKIAGVTTLRATLP